MTPTELLVKVLFATVKTVAVALSPFASTPAPPLAETASRTQSRSSQTYTGCKAGARKRLDTEALAAETPTC